MTFFGFFILARLHTGQRNFRFPWYTCPFNSRIATRHRLHVTPPD